MMASIILQARTGSTRLPGKVLLEVLGKSMIEHLIERLKAAKSCDRIIIATTTAKGDDAIAALADRLKLKTYRGSVDDVLNRFYQAGRTFGLAHIIRITADCPLMDPAVIDKGVAEYFSSGADYCSNVLKRTFPDGEDVEIFSFNTLEKTWKEAKLAFDREHVTPYIRKHPELFKLANFKNGTNISDKRWTLDKEEDLVFIKKVYEALYPVNNYFGMDEVLSFIKNNPDVEDINRKLAKKYE
jgi:spore coat polysaccharide biosynthesis protein SpsF